MEISEDQFPLITVNGLELARETLKLAELDGSDTVKDYLGKLDSSFPEYIEKKKPEDILGR